MRRAAGYRFLIFAAAVSALAASVLRADSTRRAQGARLLWRFEAGG